MFFYYNLKGNMPINSCFLKFMPDNVEGLSPMLSDNSFIEKIAKHDFISLIETWLPEGFNINIPGFYSMSKFRKKAKKARRHSGGITVLVKSSLRKRVKFFSSKVIDFYGGNLTKLSSNLVMIFIFLLFTFLHQIPIIITKVWSILLMSYRMTS